MGKIGGIIAGVILVIGLIIGIMSFERVPAGFVGIIYSMNGGIQDEILTQGYKFISPMDKVSLYSVAIEQTYLTRDNVGDSEADESFNTPTSDGKTINVDVEISFSFDQEKLPDTFNMFKGQSGEQVKQSFIKPKTKAWIQEVTSQYPVTDIFGDKRSEINQALDVHLKEKFLPYGIIIDTVNFTRTEVDAETEQAIQKIINAQQELKLAEVEADTAKITANKEAEVARIAAEQAANVANIAANQQKDIAAVNAEQARIKAEGESAVKKINADAEAYAIESKATAEAKGNKMISNSLTPAILEQYKYEQWNGALPTVQGSGVPLIDINN